jgi:hypothetical protein
MYTQEQVDALLKQRNRDNKREVRRESFIRAVLQGFAANPESWSSTNEVIASWAIELADETIKQLNEEKK